VVDILIWYFIISSTFRRNNETHKNMLW